LFSLENSNFPFRCYYLVFASLTLGFLNCNLLLYPWQERYQPLPDDNLGVGRLEENVEVGRKFRVLMLQHQVAGNRSVVPDPVVRHL